MAPIHTRSPRPRRFPRHLALAFVLVLSLSGCWYNIKLISYTPGEVLCPFEGTPLPCPYCARVENNGSFEGVTGGRAAGWFGDSTQVVREEQGITPCSFYKMLRVVATTPGGPGPDDEAITTQLIDLRDQALPDPARIVLSMLANRVPNSADSQAELVIEAFEGDPAIYPSALLRQIGYARQSFIVDNDPTTWRYLGIETDLPATTDFLAVSLIADENVFNNSNEDEFEGHYFDAVRVFIGPTEPIDLQIVTQSPLNRANSNDEVPFTITLVNHGLATANDIVIGLDYTEDELIYLNWNGDGTYVPALREWRIGSLAGGETARFTFSGLAQDNPAAAATLRAFVLTSTGTDVDPGNDEDETTIQLGTPFNFDVQLDATADQATVTQGDGVTFTLRLSNLGPQVARSSDTDSSIFYVFNPLPAGFAFDRVNGPGSAQVDHGSLHLTRYGERWEVRGPLYPDPDSSYTLRLTATAATPGIRTGHPEVGGYWGPSYGVSTVLSLLDNPANNTDSVSVEVLPDNMPYDLELTIDQNIVTSHLYTSFEVHNNGPGIASDIIVSDPILDGFTLAAATAYRPTLQQVVYDRATGLWTIPFLLPGTSILLQHRYSVQSGDYDKTSAILGTAHPGDDPANNAVTFSGSIPQPAETYDLALTMTMESLAGVIQSTSPFATESASPLTVNVGDQVAIRLTVVNHGPGAASGITLQNTLFSRQYPTAFINTSHTVRSLDPLAPGEQAELTFVARAVTPGAYTNTAYFEHGLLGDINSNNNTVTDSIIVANAGSPVAVNDSVSTVAETPVTIDVLSNDITPNNSVFNPGSVAVAGMPGNGTATANADGTITYTPAAGFTGTDRFLYTFRNDVGWISNRGTVVISVIPGANHPPIANMDNVTTSLNTAIDIDVLANDTDPDGDVITIFAAGTPLHGQTEIINNGQAIRFTPEAGFSGVTSFAYIAMDEHGAFSNEAEVAVTVSANSASR